MSKKSISALHRKRSRTLSVSTSGEHPDLHEQLDEHDISIIHEAFQKTEGKRFTENLLRRLLDIVANITYDDDEFDKLFKKINAKRDGFVTWDEFISYLILGFQQSEVSLGYSTLDPPIPMVPIILKSNHRHTINTITFAPTVKPDRTISWEDGSLMTCSKDGVINYWSLDMQLERQVQSTCPELKVSTTWVITMENLPDVSVVVTSATERDLRFYDISARKFELRVMITSFDYAIHAMHYHFTTDINEESKLILGDQCGYIKILYFSSIGRGPFKSKPGVPLLSCRYSQIANGSIKGFRVLDLGKKHTDLIRQISYYQSLHSIVSCSVCSKAALLRTDIVGGKEYPFKIAKGAWCFAMNESSHIIATGGSDCLVRIWNPFLQARPTATFYGHHAGIVQMVLQDGGKKLYTLSKDKCIKVWDMGQQACLQTYLGLPPELGEHSDMTTLYNPKGRQWIIGSTMVAVIPLDPKQSAEHTDGNTHSSGVSVVLYNPLFQCVVTCGLDSFIIVWNPWDGRRMTTVREAHTKSFHGEIIPLEITAACFDPGYHRLLTGAHDGSLKVWNFNTGVCLRNMRIERGCEIKCVLWVANRIMAIGWNRRVTEFSDSDVAVGPGGSFSKNWDLRHDDDISAAAVRIPQTLVTSSYNGDLILWRLETGQPYKKFNVSDPTSRIKIHYKAKKHRSGVEKDNKKSSKLLRDSKKEEPEKERETRGSIFVRPGTNSIAEAKSRFSTLTYVPEITSTMRKVAIHCMLFLNTRPMDPTIGSLLVALENGHIQVWSHHVAGGFLTSFSSVHKTGDYVISMASDEANEFLFIGTTIGYIKTFLLVNYMSHTKEYICMPKYRLMFPFMWKDLFVGRAKRRVASQPFPILLNSFKAHTMPVSGLAYIEDSKIILSCSADYTARMWTLSGRYIQTIGTFKSWKNIPVGKTPGDYFEYSMPPEIKRIASSTTFKVMNGGIVSKRLTKKQQQEILAKARTTVDYTKVYGKALEEPFMGNYFSLGENSAKMENFTFDCSFRYIPVYQHMLMPQPKPLNIELQQKQNGIEKEF